MSWGSFVRLLICIVFFGFLLFQYINKQNKITALRLEIPKLAQQLREIEDENTRMQFEIERFENPTHLLELSQKKEFSHLHFPCQDEVLIVP